jgi:basic membrane lipoprotein Med (substrate-binding protein (PBP1-ABC) superfamily)
MRILIASAFVAAATWSAVAQADDLKVAYLPCGNINDKSWTQVGYEGLLAAQKDLAATGTTMTVDYSESQPPAKVEAAARDYASQGYNIVILHCGTFEDAARNTARAFPDTKVLYVTVPADKSNLPPNLWYYDIAQQEVQFAAGVLAGLITKQKRVAAIASFDFPAMSRQVEGFILGVRYADESVKYSRTFINTWDDAAKAKEAALAAIDAGSDVLLADTDQAARGIFSAAESAGVYVIATYADQASLAPKAIVGSVLYDYGELIRKMVVEAAGNKLEVGKGYYLGLADGFGGWATNPQLEASLPAEAKEKFALIMEDIKTRRIVVPELIKPGDADTFDLSTLGPK